MDESKKIALFIFFVDHLSDVITLCILNFCWFVTYIWFNTIITYSLCTVFYFMFIVNNNPSALNKRATSLFPTTLYFDLLNVYWVPLILCEYYKNSLYELIIRLKTSLTICAEEEESTRCLHNQRRLTQSCCSRCWCWNQGQSPRGMTNNNRNLLNP